MNTILKRKNNDTQHLNNLCKRLKSSKTQLDTAQLDTTQLPNKTKTKTNTNTNTYYAKNNRNRKIKNNTIDNETYINHTIQNTMKQNTQHNPNLYYRKEQIPKRIREMVWSTYNGEKYSNKCYVSWCNNIINVFNYQVGHDIPESKGGTLDLSNLKPICGNCNLSMGNKYTITEWNTLIPITDTETKPETANNKTIKDAQTIIQSHINIMKNKFTNSKTISKSLNKIENILEDQEKNQQLELISNTTNPINTKPNKFVAVALLMVIIHILCF